MPDGTILGPVTQKVVVALLLLGIRAVSTSWPAFCQRGPRVMPALKERLPAAVTEANHSSTPLPGRPTPIATTAPLCQLLPVTLAACPMARTLGSMESVG